MADKVDKMVIVGILPETVVLDPGEQAVWYSNVGNIKIEFDPQRCPFSSNGMQAPPGSSALQAAPLALDSILARGEWRELALNDVVMLQGEVIDSGKTVIL